MADEELNEKPTAEDGSDVTEDTVAGTDAKPKKKVKRWPIVLGAIAIVVIAAGSAFWIWHEQPSFCAVCHTPMAEYVATYELMSGEAGTDKWGNAVENTDAMLVVTHKNHGEDCLSCHVPTIAEQVNEGIKWITGDYVFPLKERDTEKLTQARGATEDEFCLNDSCHHVTADGKELNTREDLIAATADKKRNPHVAQHQTLACSDCHKAHRTSVMYCSTCHADAEIPDGWITAADEKKLTTVK